MKKSLLALAVLGAYVGVASAQSSVTLYGTVDVNGRYVKNSDQKRRWSLDQDGINSSQLGFRGIEDLGGGLKAGFTLLASVGPDTGDIGAGQSGTGSGKFWTRRSTVSLFSNAGELRLGRDYTPTFWNNTIFDAFGTNGIGDSSHVLQLATSTFVRADNSIGYFLPSNIGGLYGQVMVAAKENGGSATGQALVGQGGNTGRYIGGRVGFAAGPFDIAGAVAQENRSSGAPDFDHQRTYNLGGSFDFGFMKLMGYGVYDKRGDANEKRGSISAVVPFGQSEIHVGYSRSRVKFDGGEHNTVWQGAATYQYNLSKRTAMYATASYINNGDDSNASVGSGGQSGLAPSFGGKSKGAEIGVRHFF